MIFGLIFLLVVLFDLAFLGGLGGGGSLVGWSGGGVDTSEKLCPEIFTQKAVLLLTRVTP